MRVHDAVRLCVAIRKFCEWRGTCDSTFLDKVECKTIMY